MDSQFRNSVIKKNDNNNKLEKIQETDKLKNVRGQL